MRSRKEITDSDSLSFPEGWFELFHKNESAILLKSDASGKDSFDWMAAFGQTADFTGNEEKNAFEEFRKFLAAQKGWAFGHFCYDLKNSTENLQTSRTSGIEFAPLSFFVPETIATAKNGIIYCDFHDEKSEKSFLGLPKTKRENITTQTAIHLKARTSKEKYIENVQSILAHIHRGDIYEINYCFEFFAEQVAIDPIEVFRKLNQSTAAPFSVLYKSNEQWLMCGSPERFLRKKGNTLLSQPIKGTRPRGNSESEDQQLKKELFNDQKERSENVMIVDLVRNDLSKSAKKGTVKVDELFGIHTFKNVHQMISSVSAELSNDVDAVEAIKNAFPMGSMTGAPKVRAMQLAEEFEEMRRGLYSGAVGYFTPEMDFDFNVVIRSIQYNSKTGYLSFMVGSAITANSDPEKEYQECLVKAKTLFEALGLKIKN